MKKIFILLTYCFSIFSYSHSSTLLTLAQSLAINTDVMEFKKTKVECIDRAKTEQEMDETGYGDIESCFYPQMNILETYKKHKERYSEFKHQAIPEDLVRNINFKSACNPDVGCIEGSYIWTGNQQFDIEMFFNGGITDFSFIEKNNGTLVVTVSNAD